MRDRYLVNTKTGQEIAVSDMTTADILLCLKHHDKMQGPLPGSDSSREIFRDRLEIELIARSLPTT